MIKIINGKRYNTEKATKVYEWYNGHMSSDFNYRRKFLFVTQSGNWFLHHRGGAMTDMAVTEGRATTGSECIEPVTHDDAYGFLEAHSDDANAVAAIERYFADRIRDA